MEEVVSKLGQAIKEFVYEFIGRVKECFEIVLKWSKEWLNSIDYNKYIKYKKYQKRVKNRKKLYAKRRAKYCK